MVEPGRQLIRKWIQLADVLAWRIFGFRNTAGQVLANGVPG